MIRASFQGLQPIATAHDAILWPEGGKHMTECRVFWVLVLVVGGWTAGTDTQTPQNDEPALSTPIMSVVGCGSRTADGIWMLTNATDGVESRVLFASDEELQEAAQQALGSKNYVLIGTTDFLSQEDLLSHPQRAQFTRPAVANATGQLQNGRKLFVKGLLITAQNEMRLNLVAVHQVSETCE